MDYKNHNLEFVKSVNEYRNRYKCSGCNIYISIPSSIEGIEGLIHFSLDGSFSIGENINSYKDFEDLTCEEIQIKKLLE